MDFTNDFFIQAQGVIERVFRAERETLIKASGNIELQIKGDKTVVTELDQQLELKLRGALTEFDKSIGLEGEEHGIEGNRNTFWLIDPIDGTEAFIRGLPFFRNMVTLIDNKQPVFALVYKPTSDELYVAGHGEGTFRNGVKVSVSQRPLKRARIEVSTSWGNPTVWPVMAAVDASIQSIRSADEFLFVVDGKFDAHLVYKSDPKPWDNAPRALLMREAGATVLNISSDSYDYTNSDMLAAHPVIFDQLNAIINKARAS